MPVPYTFYGEARYDDGAGAGTHYGDNNLAGYGQARYSEVPGRYGCHYGTSFYGSVADGYASQYGLARYGQAWFREPRQANFYGQIQSRLRHKSACGELVQARLTHRSVGYETIQARLMHRASMTSVRARFTHRCCAYGPAITLRFLHRSYCTAGQVTLELPASIHAAHTLTFDDYELAWKTGIGELTGAAFTPTGPEPLNPQLFRVTYNESAPSTWEIPVKSPLYRISPLNLKSGWAGILDVGKAMTAAITWGGDTLAYAGISTGYAHARSWERQALDFVWRGMDRSHALTAPDQTMSTVRNRMATSVVSEICAAYGIPCNLYQLALDDWLIPFMPRQKGVPMQWIQDILDVPCLEWKMVGGVVFTPYLPEEGGGATWVYDSETCARSEDLDADLQVLYNKIVVILAQQNAEVIEPTEVSSYNDGEKEPQAAVEGAPPTEVNEFRDYEVTFEPPIDGLHWRVLAAEGGMFSDFFGYDRSNTVVGYRYPRPPSSIPQAMNVPVGTEVTGYFTGGMVPSLGIGDGPFNQIAKVRFTWGEAPGNVVVQGVFGMSGVVVVSNAGVGGYGKIEFMGNRGVPSTDPPGPHAPPPGIPGPIAGVGGGTQPGVGGSGPLSESDRRVEYVDTVALAAANGIVREMELQASPLIGTRAMALKHGQRTLRRISRQKHDSSWAIPLNHKMEPGDRMYVVEEELGRTRQLVVRTPVHTFDPKPSGRGTSVRCVEYPVTVVPPTVTLLRSNPEDEDTGVQRSASINLFFSHELAPGSSSFSIARTSDDVPIPGTWKIVMTCIARFTPAQPYTSFFGEEVTVGYLATAVLAAAGSVTGEITFTYGSET